MKLKQYLLNEKVKYRHGVKVATKSQKKKFKADPQVEIDFYEKQLAQIQRMKYGPGEGSGKAQQKTSISICKSRIKEAQARLKKLNEVKVKGGYNPATLVIGYKEAKKLGIADDVEKIYLLNTPLPMKERETNVEEWKKKDSKLVLDTQILDPKNKKKVEKMLIKRYGKP